jgi:hypothetical protein
VRTAGESWLRRGCLAALAVGVCITMLSPTSLALAGAPPPPGGFRLSASNGYFLTVVSFHKPNTERGEVLVFVNAHGSGALYFTRATVTDTSIEADLGVVGEIDVDFLSSGKPRMERSECGRPVAVDSGRYVGTIDFHGEQGYSEAEATSARGDAKFTLSLVCSNSLVEGSGGHSPGALLRVGRGGGTRFSFEARKNSPSRVARFSASISERRGPLVIERAVGTEAKPAAFDYDVPAGTATVAPPAPFDGEATYNRPSKGPATWHGDLSVDFPGRAGVRLTGAGTQASLVRAVQNPSHPFRLP